MKINFFTILNSSAIVRPFHLTVNDSLIEIWSEHETQ